MTTEEIEKLKEASHYAIEHIDETSAKKLLREIVSFMQTITDPSLLRVFSQLKDGLMLVNFPNLSDIDAAKVLQKNVLLFFQLEIPFEERVQTRYIFQGQFSQNETRKVLKEAILKNQELLGELTIGQWLQKFDQVYNVETRAENDILNFLMNNAQAINLDTATRNILKKILHAYETLLASDLFSLLEVSMLKKSIQRKLDGENNILPTYTPNNLPLHNNYKKSDFSMPVSSGIQIQSTLAEAMKIYPELGEQIITGNPIKIMSFPEPVRPSIKNWIADYTYELGREMHDPIMRSNYLFHSKNTQGLSSDDRAKLSYILKAFDEKSQVTVDKTSKKIVFSNNSSVDEPKRDAQISNQSPITNDRMSKPTSPETPANKISFSSPQKLAYERKDVLQDQPYQITPATVRPQSIENRQDNRMSGKNVVNLRD